MNIKIISSLISLLTTCFVCSASEFTILPQYVVGDTIKYRTTALVKKYHKNDSLVSTTELLPELIVEEKKDKGFIVKTINKLESFQLECSDPKSKKELMLLDKTEYLNDFVASMMLRIRLGEDCRPDSILNIDEVKDSILKAYIKMFVKVQGIDIENSAEWKMDTKPLLTATVSMMYTPKHLIEEQFGNLPYFNFIGIPLKSGIIPASMVLTDELQEMCPGLTELNMEINHTEDDLEHGVGPEDGMYTIRIHGKKDTSEVESLLLYAAGILNHGILSVKTKSENGILSSSFIIDILK